MNIKTPTVEYLYSIPKSIIIKAFDQTSKQKRARLEYCDYRCQCIDYFFLWDQTKEKHAFWNKIHDSLFNEQ